MEDEQRIVIGERVLRRRDLFEREKVARRERAKFPFEEKIRTLIYLQKLARDWGGKKDVIIWEI